MAIDFPNSPSNGDIHTVSGKRWEWDGEKWTAYGASLAPDVLKVDVANNRVGINDTTPSYSLDVTGTTRVTGVITASGGVVGNVTGNASGSSGSTTGNAATATALATARTIGGTSFDGTGNIAVALAATATEATNITAVANNSTDETVYPTFVDGATGTQGIETDTGFTYNPSTGLLTAAAFSGPLTGNVTGNASGTALTVTQAAQSAITSLGTLTSLTVSSTSSVVGMILDGTTHPAITLKGGGTTRGYIGIATANTGFVNNSVTGDVILRADGGTALHLGTTSGAAALTIAGANVGIGTISPVCALSVTSGATNSSAHFGRYDDEGLFLHSDAGSGNYNWRITTQTEVDQGFEIAPSTAVGGQTWEDPVFVIKVDGKVGIGTTSPTHKLHAAGATFLLDGKLYLGDNAGSVSSVYNLYSNSSNLFLNAASGSAIYNRINNATFMNINGYGTSIRYGDTGCDSRMSLRVGGENIFMSDKTTIGRTSSGAMAIFGHNVYASTTANNTVNCADANYYGQFMRMYHAYGITFHVSTGSFSADAVMQNSWTGASSTNTCDEAVVIGRSTGGGYLGIRGYGANEGGQLQFFGGSSYGQDMYFDRYNNDIRMIWGGVQKVGFANTGNIQNSNNSYGALSDERLKTDITPARNYLADLLNLEVVNFVKDKEFFPTKIPVLDDEGNPTYRPVSVLDSDGFETYDADGMPITADGTAIYNQSPTEGAFELLDTPGIKQLGLIAQQVEPHLPGLIEEDSYGVKAIKYSVLVPMLLQAVQTLTARVTELEAG